MKKTISREGPKTLGFAAAEFSGLERYFLMHAHPRMLIIDGIAWTWAIYLLWHFRWGEALVSVVLGGIIGWFTVRKVDPNALAETMLGKIALLHLHPVNLTLQTIGLIPLLYGIWIHSTATVLVGVSALAVGHLFGWDSVDRRFHSGKAPLDNAA